MTQRFDHSLDEINAMLHARAFDVVERVFGRGRVQRVGNQAWILNPARKDPNWTSFSYNLVTDVWKDFSDATGETSGKGGLSLIAMFATRGQYKSERDGNGVIVREGAVEWAKRFLGLSDRPLSPAEARAFEARQAKDRERAEAAAARARSAALRIWTEAMKRENGATPLTGSDPASLYLESRGIAVVRMREGLPRALAFHPAVYAYDPDPALRGPYPAMIGCISLEGLPHGFGGLHRTYLERAGGTWRKRTWASCESGKQVKGAGWAGGSIRLTRGLSNRPLASARDGEWVQISEGIEDGLTAAIAQPDLRTLVAVSISNIGGLKLPPAVKGAQIWAQNDDEPAAIKQFDRAMDQLVDRGIEPTIVRMPARFKDANDLLQGKTKSGSAAPLEASPAA